MSALPSRAPAIPHVTLVRLVEAPLGLARFEAPPLPLRTLGSPLFLRRRLRGLGGDGKLELRTSASAGENKNQ